jgi:hypothetical protein
VSSFLIPGIQSDILILMLVVPDRSVKFTIDALCPYMVVDLSRFSPFIAFYVDIGVVIVEVK